jgi:modulator of FtsH protease
MNAAYAPGQWSNFFIALTGASAALTGLVIVAMSINLATILKERSISGRAGETVSLLACILVVSVFGIVPGQPDWVLGLEILAAGLVAWIGTTIISARAGRHPQEPRWLREAITHGASFPVVLAGATLILQKGGGLYWLVPGIVAAFVGGVINTWVLLVEVLR